MCVASSSQYFCGTNRIFRCITFSACLISSMNLDPNNRAACGIYVRFTGMEVQLSIRPFNYDLRDSANSTDRSFSFLLLLNTVSCPLSIIAGYAIVEVLFWALFISGSLLNFSDLSSVF